MTPNYPFHFEYMAICPHCRGRQDRRCPLCEGDQDVPHWAAQEYRMGLQTSTCPNRRAIAISVRQLLDECS
jgi:hypothetical protein